MAPSRREVLAAAGSIALAGCGTPGPATDPSPTSPPGGGDRPTATARDPEPLEVAGAWPQRGGGPGHAGVADASGVPGDGRAYWRLRRIRSGPVVLADGRLFHYAELGEDAGGRATLTPTPDPAEGPAHIVNGPPYLVARDASDGRIAWAAPLPDGGAGWPAIADGRVVTATAGRVAVREATDGTTVRSADLGERPLGDPAVVGDVVVVALGGVVDGGTDEYVHEPAVRAYDLADGAERWTATMPKRGLGLAVGDGTVAVVATDFEGPGTVLGLALADGSERWRTAVPGGFFATPVVAGGTAYVATGDDTLHALALEDGSERWRRGFDDHPTAPAVTGRTAYVGAGDRLFALDTADGSQRWGFGAVDGESFVAAAVGDDVVYAGARGTEAGLYALDAAAAAERWRFRFPNTTVEGDIITSGLETQPTVVDGAVYAYAADGLYAFGPA